MDIITKTCVLPRCSICTYLPSASSLQSASRGRPGTLWGCRRCSVVSRPCREGTGRTLGRQMSRGRGTGTLAVCPAAGRPRIERLWRAESKKQKNPKVILSSAPNSGGRISNETHLAAQHFGLKLNFFFYFFFYNLECVPNQSFQ